MKNIYYLLTCMTIFVWSCQKDDLTKEIKDLPKVSITQDEYMSIAYDSPRTLSETEAINLVANFKTSNNLSRSKGEELSIKRKYSIGETCGELSRSTNAQQAITVYEVSINDTESNGIAIVAADERVAGIIAYIPKIESEPEKEVEQRGLNFMLNLSEASTLNRLAYIDSIRSTLRDSTLLKISNKLGIPMDKISFEQIKNNIDIKNNELSRSKPEGTPPYNPSLPIPNVYFLSVDWSQDEPYNRLLGTYPDVNFPNVTWHYPLGCAVVALMHVHSFFETRMEGYDDGQKMVVNWSYLKENRTITEPSYGPGGDPIEKIKMVSRMAFWIFNGTKTKTIYANSRYESSTDNKEIARDLDVYKIAHEPLKNLNKSSWDELSKLINDVRDYHIALMGGTRSNGGRHVWVLDGYAAYNEFLSPNHFLVKEYLHANMGWGGSSNGWYYIDPTLTFETDNGIYGTNFWYISKLRK